MSELQNQEEIDVLFGGASHVSHGLSPAIIDRELGIKAFCSGTPTQRLDATFTIIKLASKLYHLKKVYLECDFAILADPIKKEFSGEPEKSSFLVYHYINDRAIKYRYLFTTLHPKYYLNALLPIGREQLITLNPKSIFHIAASKLSGRYYRDPPHLENAIYSEKGCVLDNDAVASGTFTSSAVLPIQVGNMNSELDSALTRIIKFLDEKGIEVVFYSNPSTDFYLAGKKNYDEYLERLKALLNKHKKDYYDFSLIKPSFLSPETTDFMDDNHLNRFGVEKFSYAFCQFEKSEVEREGMFYRTYEEKLESIPHSIFGLILTENARKTALLMRPVTNCTEEMLADSFKLSVTSLVNGERTPLEVVQKDGFYEVSLPQKTTGTLEIASFLAGKEETRTEYNYVGM